jgi:hypothetical protein
MDWETSTEGAFLAGANLPVQGQAVTLIAIRPEMMQRRDGNGQEQVYIGSFSDCQQEWVINKTNRKFLRESCGITNANVTAFAPIALTLVQNHTPMGTGILAQLRAVAPLPLAAVPPVPPVQPVAPPVVQPANIPAADDGVPF